MTPLAVTPDDPDSLDVLLVEDDPDIGALLRAIFEENPDYAANLTEVGTLAETLDLLEQRSFDAIVLDLGLPDSDGLRTARQVTDVVTPPVAVVVFTAQRDQSLASQTLELGVQDYVVKEDISPALATRVVAHGVARARMAHELQQARRGQERERELRRMERLAGQSTTTVSAAMLGSESVAQRLGDRYEDELVAEYSRILRRSLDEQAFRVEGTVDTDVRSLASVLGYLGASPRDVVELHSTCLRRLVHDDDSIAASAMVEEARVVVLQLMGRLAAWYRDRAVIASRGDARASSTGREAPDARVDELSERRGSTIGEVS